MNILRIRTILLVLAFAVLPIAMLIWQSMENFKTVQQFTADRLINNLNGISRDLDNKISSTSQLLFGLSRVELLSTASKAECSKFLAEVFKENPQYTGILTIKPDGELHCDSLSTGRVLNLKDRPYFQKAIESRLPVIEPAIGRLTGKNVLQIAYPVFKKDVLQYVLLASLDLDIFGYAEVSTLPFVGMHLQFWNEPGTFTLDYVKNGIDKNLIGVTTEMREFILTQEEQTTIQVFTNEKDTTYVVKTLLPKRSELDLTLVLLVSENPVNDYINSQSKQGVTILVFFILLILMLTSAVFEIIIAKSNLNKGK